MEIFSIKVQYSVNSTDFSDAHSKNEHERDVHYFTTMAKHLTNSRKLESSNKQLDKKFDKLDNIRLTRFVKSEDEIPNDKKALTYLNIKLNTKTAFKNMPTEDGIIIQKDFEGIPNPYTIYENIVERIRKNNSTSY